jgi:hypothetical protein
VLIITTELDPFIGAGLIRVGSFCYAAALCCAASRGGRSGEPMWPKGIVLPAPAICEKLSHRSRDEQLVIEKRIPEPSVKRLGKTFLPQEFQSMIRNAAS